MKKLLAVPLILISVVYFSCAEEEPYNPEDYKYVYVCPSNSAKTYHTDRNCPRLKNCKESILEVTRKKARENERVICSDCSRRDAKIQQDSTGK